MAIMVLICGVSGAGKTTIGQLLAKDLGWEFFERDDYSGGLASGPPAAPNVLLCGRATVATAS